MGTSLSFDGSSRSKVLGTSCIFMGLSHILYLKQYIKGILFALVEVLFLCYTPTLIENIKDMIEISRWYQNIRPATFRLMDGIMAVGIIAIFAIAYVVSVKSAVTGYEEYCLDGRCKSNKESMQGAVGKAFPLLGLAPALGLVIFFVIMPLVFSITVGFTNWSSPDHLTPGSPVDWVGLENYFDMFGGNSDWSSAFGRVAVWTIAWGLLATATCYFGGMVLAAFLYEANLKVTPIFRAILILPYAIPNILTIKVWQVLLNGSTGIINKTLKEIGIISESIGWLTDKDIVKVVCILINMWVGVPYFMMLITGQMTAISTDVFEAATIDGASKIQIFRYITLPLVLYQTVPLIIMSFTHNVNNFGAIYFLTGGAPNISNTTVSGAGTTDLLVTWIYKLTMNELQYCKASVLAMLVFIVLAPFAVWNFKNTKSYKEGEL